MTQNHHRTEPTFHQLQRASDADLLAALLDIPDPRRASALLATTGSLVNLATAGPLELMALPLTASEQGRLALHGELVTRILTRLRLAPRNASLFEPLQ